MFSSMLKSTRALFRNSIAAKKSIIAIEETFKITKVSLRLATPGAVIAIIPEAAQDVTWPGVKVVKSACLEPGNAIVIQNSFFKGFTHSSYDVTLELEAIKPGHSLVFRSLAEKVRDEEQVTRKYADMVAVDHLFNLRNNYYLGAYQAAINNSDVPNLSSDDAVECDCLIYLCHIALGSYQHVINEIEIDSCVATPLQAVRLLALYLSSPDAKESAISSLKEWLADPAIANNMLRWIAGTIFMHEEDYNEALKHTTAGGTMELHALNVQIFIKMQRLDYAEKQLRIMQQIDEDHTLTQLARAWLNLAVGGSKIQEAYLIFLDFSEKYPMTGLIRNGKAVCFMHVGKFDEAETLLLEALNKDAKDPETLANLVVCSLHLGKSSSFYLSQLKLSHPNHILVKQSSSAVDNFDRAVQSVA